MVRYKLSIIYAELSHINRILNLEILIRKICLMMSTYELPVIYLYLNLKLGTKYMIVYTRQDMTLIHIFRVREFFHDNVIFFTTAALLI